MIRRIFISLFLSAIICSGAVAQDKNVELSIQFLSNEKLGDINFKAKAFAAHGKEAIELLEEFFSNYSKPQEIVILESLHTDKAPTFSIHARPAMLVTDMATVIKKLQKTKPVRGKHASFHLAYIINIKGGISDKNAAYVPEMKVPIQLAFEAMEDASLSKKQELLQKWAQEEVLPILSALELNADSKFEGINTLGKQISKIAWDNEVDILELTEKNPAFWKATIEMSLGNQLIGTSKIFLHVAAGEFDYIKLFLELLPSFSDPKTISSYYLKELKWRMDIFYAELEAQINGGVLIHDGGKYMEAVATYKRILKDYPNSAWALYETYFSEATYRTKPKKIQEDTYEYWDIASVNIFKANPLYRVERRANTQKEAYLLFRRAEIQELFNKVEDINSDFIQLADIALDLEVYAFAAHFYWLALSGVPVEEHGGRELVYYFLYCLDKLGEQEIKKNFKGDMDAEFKKISEAREKAMKESSVYQNFKKKR